MTNIYIKSFNRPFYLDRCIRSVKFNIKGYERIIVLDDGTLSVYLDRLATLHPDVEFRRSGATDNKVALLRQEAFREIERTCPSALQFWTAEIARDPNDFVLVLEEDAWITRSFDLSAVVANMVENQSVITKLWWSNETNTVTETYRFPNGFGIQYISPDIGSMFDAYQIWIVAFSVFDKNYWLKNVSAAMRLGDENSQLVSAMNYRNHHPRARYAVTDGRSLHQGWMVPGRSTPEYYDKGLRQHVFMDAANELWLAGRLDVTEGYPYDFSDAYFGGLVADVVSPEDHRIWRLWRDNEVRYFYDFA